MWGIVEFVVDRPRFNTRIKQMRMLIKFLIWVFYNWHKDECLCATTFTWGFTKRGHRLDSCSTNGFLFRIVGELIKVSTGFIVQN